jgi:hypothetical protein
MIRPDRNIAGSFDSGKNCSARDSGVFEASETDDASVPYESVRHEKAGRLISPAALPDALKVRRHRL